MKKINIVQSLKCRTLFVVGLLFLFTNCEPKFQEYQDVLKIKLINETEKRVIVDIAVSSGEPKRHYVLKVDDSNNQDSIVISKILKYEREFLFEIQSARIYDISDTTSREWFYWQDSMDTEADKIYKESWNTTYEKDSITGDLSRTYIFYPNKRLFAIMQKDYSMLDKFPEYYLKP